MVSEAWYAHKLFIYLNLFLHTAHIAMFAGLHSKIFLMLAIVRCVVLSLIVVTQCLTVKRSAKDRLTRSNPRVDVYSIERSMSFIDRSEFRNDPQYMERSNFKFESSSPRHSVKTLNGPNQRSRTVYRNPSQVKLESVGISLHVKIEKVKRNHDEYMLSFSTYAQKLPERVP